MKFLQMLDDYEQQVVSDIEQHGWHGVVVPEGEHGPGFEYTVGLLGGYRHPEVIVFGLSEERSHALLWAVVRDIRSGREFRVAQRYENLVQRFACVTRPVAPKRFAEYLGYALWHRRYSGNFDPFEAVQLFWPDQQGLFPWETACNPAVVQLQPDLSES